MKTQNMSREEFAALYMKVAADVDRDQLMRIERIAPALRIHDATDSIGPTPHDCPPISMSSRQIAQTLAIVIYERHPPGADIPMSRAELEGYLMIAAEHGRRQF